jgi:hypothetical protein
VGSQQTTDPAGSLSFVRAISGISGIYDAAVGVFLLVGADRFAALFHVAPARPPIFADLNGLFLLAVAAGYYWPYRDPVGARWYLWIMGVALKSAGALTFILDYTIRHSPASFLLFAASDGALALITLAALAGSRSTLERLRR